MKIGEKRFKKIGQTKFTVERIKFDWKALIVWLIVIILALYLIFWR